MSPNYALQHFTSLSTGWYPFKFPTAPFHLTSLHFTSLHYTSLHFTSHHWTSLHSTTLHLTSHHSTFGWFSPHFYSFNFNPFKSVFPTPFLNIFGLQWKVPIVINKANSARNWNQQVTKSCWSFDLNLSDFTWTSLDILHTTTGQLHSQQWTIFADSLKDKRF